jgi:hypothetical protein
MEQREHKTLRPFSVFGRVGGFVIRSLAGRSNDGVNPDQAVFEILVEGQHSHLKSFPNPSKSNIYLHDGGEGDSLLAISCAGSEARKNVDAWNSRFGGVGCARCGGVCVCRVEGEPGRR